MANEVVGARYRIVKELGSGSMGQVYLAEHTELERREALKVLKPDLAVDPTFVSRFRREARAANRVQHPNIVGVYDFGQLPDGRMFLAMELADGPPLDNVLRAEGRFPIARALHVAVQLAGAVDHAHSRGVIHRDLKPHNMILVEYRGHADVLKVLDFGIAKIICSDYNETVALTRDGDVFGTPAYMAPEMVNATGTDPRSDIYSIGCIIYELVVGQPPFAGKRVQLWHAHVNDKPIRPSERCPEAKIPTLLDTIIMSCLEKLPERRFQTASGLAAALRQVPGYIGRRPMVGNAGDTRIDDSGVASYASHSAVDTAPGPLDEDIATAETAYVSAAELEASLRAIVLELGEGLSDLGVANHQLSLLLGQVHGLEDDFARNDASMAALQIREEKLEQAAREREGSLRFAIGELQFDREREEDQAKRADLGHQIVALTGRLRELLSESETELNAITSEELDLATARASLEEVRERTFARLGAAVDNLISRERGSSLAPTIERYHGLRAMLKRAARRRG